MRAVSCPWWREHAGRARKANTVEPDPKRREEAQTLFAHPRRHAMNKCHHVRGKDSKKIVKPNRDGLR